MVALNAKKMSKYRMSPVDDAAVGR